MHARLHAPHAARERDLVDALPADDPDEEVAARDAGLPPEDVAPQGDLETAKDLESASDPPARGSEALLLAAMQGLALGQLLATTAGYGHLARQAAATGQAGHVVLHELDLYRTERVQALVEPAWRERIEIVCQSDFPTREFDTAALPTSSRGEAELTREWLQQAYERLRIGGVLWTATDNPRDRWLEAELAKLAPKVTRFAAESGVVYRAEKLAPLKKAKRFAAEFAFRDHGKLLRAYSRPGVFAHRRLDTGARRLLDAIDVGPHDRVLDIGCGAGTVAAGLAARHSSLHVLAIDSNARAIECARRTAELNGLTNIILRHNADGAIEAPGTYTKCAANPPYYSGFRIAQLFVDAARRALVPDGELVVVTKSPDWYFETLPAWFDGVSIVEQKGYYVARGNLRSV